MAESITELFAVLRKLMDEVGVVNIAMLQIKSKPPTFKTKMPGLHNREYLTQIRKHLRNNSTAAEATLWKILKKRQVGGYKFRRQHSIGKYVVDFYCPELQLVLELDGEPHANLVNNATDIDRDEFIESNRITVFRYENRWVYEYPEVIIQEILEFGEKKELGSVK